MDTGRGDFQNLSPGFDYTRVRLLCGGVNFAIVEEGVESLSQGVTGASNQYQES
jgi:hypothetical protein